MINNKSPIGVFDSGVGGISVLGELFKLMPEENYIYLGDSANAPYGTKDEDEVRKHTYACADYLINKGVKAIVIACNTATSVAAAELRNSYNLPIIGIEPAVKPAAENHKGEVVAVMATPMTLKKEKFLNLMKSYGNISEIIPLPCPNLVEIIENGYTSGEEIESYLTKLFSPLKGKKISVVVLGCTHYPFIKNSIKKILGFDTDIIDGGKGTARETKRRLENLNLLNLSGNNGKIEFLNSKNSSEEIDLMKKMFEKAKKLS